MTESNLMHIAYPGKERGKAHGGEATWRNWSGSVAANPARILSPATVDALAEAVRTAPGPLRVAGAGHSFTPLVESAGTILQLDAFSGMSAHDATAVTATIGAATLLGQLTPALQAVGQALPNMGDVDSQTLGGALATATHGSGLTLGAYHTQVRRMALVDGMGKFREIDAARDPDLLHATGVTLGMFGALTDVTLQNIPAYRLRRRRWIVPLEQIFGDFEGFLRGHRSAEFFFIPFSGHVLLSACDLSDAAAGSRPKDDDEQALAILRRLRSWLGWAPWLRRKLIAAALKGIPAEDYVQDWLNVYTSERLTRFNEMEYHLPLDAGPAALREIITLSETRFPHVYFPMEIRCVAPDEFWLSPFYRRPTCSIAVHHDAAENPLPFMREAEKIFRKYDGRPHWGKMHSLTAQDLRQLYPRFDAVLEVRREFDPENRFVSPYLARLLGLDG